MVKDIGAKIFASMIHLMIEYIHIDKILEDIYL